MTSTTPPKKYVPHQTERRRCVSKMGASSSQPAWSFEDIPDLTGFRVLVTGGNAGIGKAAVENFIQFSNCEKVTIKPPAPSSLHGCAWLGCTVATARSRSRYTIPTA